MYAAAAVAAEQQREEEGVDIRCYAWAQLKALLELPQNALPDEEGTRPTSIAIISIGLRKWAEAKGGVARACNTVKGIVPVLSEVANKDRADM